MDGKIFKLVNQSCVTIITGECSSARSLLLDSLEDVSFSVNRDDQVIEVGCQLLSDTDMELIKSTSHEFIVLDNAKNINAEQLLEIAGHSISTGKKLLISSGSKHDILYSKLLNLCLSNEKPLLHAEISEVGFDIVYGSKVSKEDLFCAA
jgi:hypothetical protein